MQIVLRIKVKPGLTDFSRESEHKSVTASHGGKGRI